MRLLLARRKKPGVVLVTVPQCALRELKWDQATRVASQSASHGEIVSISAVEQGGYKLWLDGKLAARSEHLTEGRYYLPSVEGGALMLRRMHE